MASDKMMDAFETAQLQGIDRRTTDVDLATARQRDGAAFDHRALNYFGLGTLFISDDGERAAALNAGVRVPTTLNQPGAVVGGAAG